MKTIYVIITYTYGVGNRITIIWFETKFKGIYAILMAIYLSRHGSDRAYELLLQSLRGNVSVNVQPKLSNPYV